MKVTVSNKDWDVKPITPPKKRELFTKYTSNQPDIDKDGNYVREQYKEEKEIITNIYFECLDIAGIPEEELPKNMVEQLLLGMAICTEYLGFDKKKLSEQESEDG